MGELQEVDGLTKDSLISYMEGEEHKVTEVYILDFMMVDSARTHNRVGFVLSSHLRDKYHDVIINLGNRLRKQRSEWLKPDLTVEEMLSMFAGDETWMLTETEALRYQPPFMANVSMNSILTNSQGEHLRVTAGGCLVLPQTVLEFLKDIFHFEANDVYKKARRSYKRRWKFKLMQLKED